jgi:hypothetical protein
MEIDINIYKEDLDFDSVGINIKDWESKYNDTNHILNTSSYFNKVVDENPNEPPTVVIHSLARISPSGKIVIYDDNTWENIEDYKAKQLFEFMCDNINIWKYKIKSKSRGYICGVKSPFGNRVVEHMSTNLTHEYEIWQKIELIN